MAPKPNQVWVPRSKQPVDETAPPAQTNQATSAALHQIQPSVTDTSPSSPVETPLQPQVSSPVDSPPQLPFTGRLRSSRNPPLHQNQSSPSPGAKHRPHDTRRQLNQSDPPSSSSPLHRTAQQQLPPQSFLPQGVQEQQSLGSRSSASPPAKIANPHHTVPGNGDRTGQQLPGSPYSPHTSQRPEIHQSPLPRPSFPQQRAQQRSLGSRRSASPPVKIPSPHHTVLKTSDDNLPSRLDKQSSPQQQHGVSSSATGSPNGPDETVLANSFLEIVRGFTIPGEKTALYKAQVASLVRRGTPVLVVDFEHILTNMELAVKVASSGSSYVWLQSVVRTFLNEECGEMNMEDKKKFLQAASVSFINKPEFVISLKDVKIKKKDLVKALRIMHGQESCTAASTFGREVYLSVLIFVFGKHRKGLSWNGDFAEEDVYFFRYSGRLLECRIMKSTDPSPAALSARDIFNPQQCKPEERKKDLGNVDTLLTDSYKDAEGNLPVYFDDLHDDLLSMPPSVVVEEWFMENLVYDLALMPSIARKILTAGIHNAIRSLKLSLVEEYKRILQEAPYSFDWRPKVKAMEGVMKGVYWFENVEEDESKDQYKDSMESAIGYKRHTHKHCHKYLDGEKRLDDVDEGELLTAIKLPGVLSKLVKALMKLNMMGGGLAAVREAYCASRANQKEPATEMLYVQENFSGEL